MRGRADTGRRLSDAERWEIRTRIAAGATHWETAEAVGCSTKTVQFLLKKTGGLPPRTVVRSSLRLSLCEREEISRGLKAGDSYRAIDRCLGRSPSTDLALVQNLEYSQTRYFERLAASVNRILEILAE